MAKQRRPDPFVLHTRRAWLCPSGLVASHSRHTEDSHHYDRQQHTTTTTPRVRYPARNVRLAPAEYTLLPHLMQSSIKRHFDTNRPYQRTIMFKAAQRPTCHMGLDCGWSARRLMTGSTSMSLPLCLSLSLLPPYPSLHQLAAPILANLPSGVEQGAGRNTSLPVYGGVCCMAMGDIGEILPKIDTRLRAPRCPSRD